MSGFINPSCRIEGDRVITPGVDYGPKGLNIIARHGRYMVLKQPGHSGWSGQGQTSYYATRYHLVELKKERLVSELPDTHEYFETLEELEPGSRYREAIDTLTTKARDLATLEYGDGTGAET